MIAEQPWCDGHVNLMGISYGGFTGAQVATHRPPHLTSIIPVDADDRYTDDRHYRGGLLRMYYDIGWYGTRMIAWNAMPPDPSTFGERWAGLAPPHRRGRAAPARVAPAPDRRAVLATGLGGRVTGPHHLPGIHHRRLARRLPEPAPSSLRGLRAPAKVLVGPWDHAMPDGAMRGRASTISARSSAGSTTGARASTPGSWTNHSVAVYIQEAGSLSPNRLDTPGEWRAEAVWPPPGAEVRRLDLPAGSADAPGDTAPVLDGVDAFDYDATVGTAGGLWSGGVPFGLSGDQRGDEAPSLVYTSEPLDEPLTMLRAGAGRAPRLVDRPDRRLRHEPADVDPEGRSHLVAKGMLNATRRGSPDRTAPAPARRGREARRRHRRDGLAVPARSPNPALHRVGGLAERLAHALSGDQPRRPRPRPASHLILPAVPPTGSAPSPTFEPSSVVVRPPSEVAPPPT